MRTKHEGPFDLIIYNGKVISGDSSGNIFESIAVKADRIAGLGTSEQMLSLKSEYTELIDLKGKVLIPGLIESHSHILGAALSEIEGELYSPSSVQELLHHIKERVKLVEKGEWLFFNNIYPARLDEYRFPTIQELDVAAPGNPVFINGVYAGQANSCALDIVGINESSTFPNGIVCKDKATGKLTGTLFFLSDLFTKYKAAPIYDDNEVLNTIEKLLQNYNKLGITSIIDGNTSAKAISLFNRLYADGRLTVRLNYTLSPSGIKNMDETIRSFVAGINTPPEWGKTAFLKKTIDGGILTGTCLMRKPYGNGCKVFGITDDSFCGIALLNKDQLVEYITKAYDCGLQMTAHCIGNAATDRFIEAYEEVDKLKPLAGRRFSIIHADFTDNGILSRVKKLGLNLISQPAWHYMDASILNEILDEETMKSFLPYKEMEDLGVDVCAGSDHMVKMDSVTSINPYNPFLGMYNLITRKTRKGDVIFPEQKVTRERALTMYTLNGAYTSFDEKEKGSLEIGKLADMAVLSKDYLCCREDEIPYIKSVLTIIGGKIVYDSQSSKGS